MHGRTRDSRNPVEFDQALEALPNHQAVFLLWPREGKPFLARTNVLRKRLKRLLGNLRGTADASNTICGSRLEAQFLLLDLARSTWTFVSRRFGCACRLT